ncbi:hypothetical protein HID58_053599 [Brassica napus]|uniref:Uncharacterized protein n=1 Tax=Brassica napus TaxID=3708 RepID=A0ABQ8AF66_BRANA|nr:hypothetical protein HID58_053599 [Brassica napus]
MSTGGTVTYTHQPRPPSSIVHFSATNSSMESEILLASTVSPSPTSMLADAFEIHSLFGCRADRVRFSAKSSQLGLCTLDVAYGSRASHRKLLPVNISTRCINVVFDYHLGEQSPWNKSKVFIGYDSPQDSFIFSYFVMLFSLVLPLVSESSTSVVNVVAH